MFLGFPITGIVLCLVYISADDGICTSTDGCLENSAELDDNSNRYDEGNEKYFILYSNVFVSQPAS